MNAGRADGRIRCIALFDKEGWDRIEVLLKNDELIDGRELRPEMHRPEDVSSVHGVRVGSDEFWNLVDWSNARFVYKHRKIKGEKTFVPILL